MTSSIRDITFQLRQGQLIALADETGWSVVSDPVNDKAVEQLLTLWGTMPAGLQPTVLIQQSEQLRMYVSKVPDIAYDLVEFAEIPLTVIYEQGKNLSSVVWRSAELQPETPKVGSDGMPITGEIAVRRSLNDEIQRLIGGFGRGLLTIPLESLLLPPAAEALIAGRFGLLPAMPKRPRIMRLGTSGEVSFIRK